MQQFSSLSTGQGLVDTVTGWLAEQALGRQTIEELLDGTCQRLHAIGVPIGRAHLVFSTLHPQIATTSVTWRLAGGVERTDFPHELVGTTDAWFSSPLYFLHSTQAKVLRRRLTGPSAVKDFPVLEELAAEGFTDYLAHAVGFTTPAEARWKDNTGIIATWACNREGGFTDEDIATILRVQQRLAVACKVSILDQITVNLLQTYLGEDAGRAVLDGAIRRGDGTLTHAVIWYSDLRNSTRMADTLPSDVYLQTLNAYFEMTAGTVRRHGGDILTFIGDGVLAIFPVEGGNGTDRGAVDDCPQRRAALDAALEAVRLGEEAAPLRAAAGEPPIRFGIGLHVGDVVFGNIGIPERLAFTTIGPAVNEVSRLDALTKVLDRPVLATELFVHGLNAAFEALGSQVLRGVGEPREVFAPVMPVQAPADDTALPNGSAATAHA